MDDKEKLGRLFDKCLLLINRLKSHIMRQLWVRKMSFAINYHPRPIDELSQIHNNILMLSLLNRKN